MKIAHIAHINFPIPPSGYGGIERVIDEMIQCQVRVGGCDIALYAPSDSRIAVDLRAVVSSYQSLQQELTPQEIMELERQHYTFACTYSDDCALLHAHEHHILSYAHLTDKPLLLSLYADTSNPEMQAILQARPANVFLVANSESTRANFVEAGWFGVVLEGIMLEKYPYHAEKSDELVFVGLLMPHKGAHIAIQVALQTGLKLKLIGRKTLVSAPASVRKIQETYMKTEIEPYIDNKQITYLGEMGEERLEHIKRARAVLCPIQWEEPFGRIMAESMACGTPVVAMRRGAAPEVVRDGVSGFIVEDISSMVAAVREVHRLEPAACREHVRQHLNMERVAQQYLDLYRRLLAMTR